MHWHVYLTWFLIAAAFNLICMVLAFKKPEVEYDGFEYTVHVYFAGRTGTFNWKYIFVPKGNNYIFKPTVAQILWLLGTIVVFTAVFALGESDSPVTREFLGNPFILGPAGAIGMYLPSFVVANICIHNYKP